MSHPLPKPLLSKATWKKTAEAPDSTLLRGCSDRITFHNAENGYCILQLRIPGQDELTTITGTYFSPKTGQDLVMRGVFVEHPKFGRQFKAHSITEIEPSTEDGILRYLASGTIKGIGKKTARRIVKTFGAQTLDMIRKHPDMVAKIEGVGQARADILHEAFREQDEHQETLRYLLENKISPGLAGRIIKQYGQNAVEIIKRDPYSLARHMHGVGFQTADTLALSLGLVMHSPQRLRAGLYYALERARDDGHCFLYEAALFAKAHALLGLEENFNLEPELDTLVKEASIVVEQGLEGKAIYLKNMHEAEHELANMLRSRITHTKRQLYSEEGLLAALQGAETDLGITLSPEQREAARLSLRHSLLLITGGPGCGKTTVIRAIVAAFRALGSRIALAAPTGKASQRMSQVCSMGAKTIHRLLRFDPSTRSFFYNAGQPLEVEGQLVDVVIVDESSMLDLLLARDLFAALPQDTTVIFVGDKDQLPSVGPGRVFADLIALAPIKTIFLSKLFRRAEESRINTVAHMVNAGNIPPIPEPDGRTQSDAYFLPKADAEQAAQLIEKLVADQIPRKFHIPTEDIVVLTPGNRGLLGTSALNERLQKALNVHARESSGLFVSLPHGNIYLGDKVCQRVNNYNIDTYGVFNGDTGTVISIDPNAKRVQVELWDGRLITYDDSNIGQLTLAYAFTIHRSQGSEAPCVVLALHESHYTLLERQLLYTGVTRAKKLLVVVGSKKALAIAARRASGAKRCSRLTERILAHGTNASLANENHSS